MYVCMYVWESDLAVCMYVCMYVCMSCPGNDLCIMCLFQKETKQKTKSLTIEKHNMCLRRYGLPFTHL